MATLVTRRHRPGRGSANSVTKEEFKYSVKYDIALEPAKNILSQKHSHKHDLLRVSHQNTGMDITDGNNYDNVIIYTLC